MPELHRATPLDGVRSFDVVLGDITAQDVDAIVNAANSHLSHGGGVAAAIARAGGPELERASREHVREEGPVPAGDAAVTRAGDLPHQGVIHAVGPRQGDGDEEETLTRAVAAALDRAHENGWRSVAMPAISAGIFGVPYDVCARAYLAGVRRHLDLTPDSSLERVILCLYRPDEALVEAVDAVLDEEA